MTCVIRRTFPRRSLLSLVDTYPFMHIHAFMSRTPKQPPKPVFTPSGLSLGHFGETDIKHVPWGSGIKQRGLQELLPACEGAARCFRCGH
jgi:hypothetical protein